MLFIMSCTTTNYKLCLEYKYMCMCVYTCVYLVYVYLLEFCGDKKFKKLISIPKNISEKYDGVRNKRLYKIK